MSSLRYSLLGLARPRAAWFTELGRWATAGTLPVDFVRCVSGEEVRARLASDRPYSALLVDSSVPGLDRDLVDRARATGCATLVVAEGGPLRDWSGLGVAGVLTAPLDRVELLDALEHHATSLADVQAHPGAPAPVRSAGWRGRLVAVTGPGGTGASVTAMALAQALGDDARNAGRVVLADLVLDADQALLHGAPDVVPGVSELVEAHRSARPDAAGVRATTFDVAGRGYQLLLGLRRRRDWAALRPRAVEAAVDGLLQAYRHVVADIDADVDGDAECGSVEVEERNVLARTAVGRADAIVVVGSSDLKGLHGLLRVLADLVEHGVDPARLLAVVNRAPRSPRARAELNRSFAQLADGFVDAGRLPGLLHLPVQRRLEEALRDGVRLPGSAGRDLAAAVDAVVARSGPADDEPTPARIAAGSLGTFWDDRAAS